MPAGMDGAAPAVYPDEIAGPDHAVIDHGVAFRLVDPELAETHDADFLKLRNRHGRVGRGAAFGG